MGKSRFLKLILPAVAIVSFAVAVPPAGQDMPSLSFEGWRRSGELEIYKKDGLFGYIDGGAEIFLQYGFRELSVTRYAAAAGPGKTAPKTVTLEIYRMESPADAFGIFSIKRSGNEYVSPAIGALHWTSGGQANLVKGDYFINIQSEGIAEEEIRPFVAAVSARIAASLHLPLQLSWLPPRGLIPGSERYIRGDLAAAEESPLLGQGFWGFGEGTKAVSARYRPSGARLVIVRLEKDRGGLAEMTLALFREYLEDVGAEEGEIRGKNASGRYFVFRHRAPWAFLVLGEPDLASAQLLLEEAEKEVGISYNNNDKSLKRRRS